MSLIDRAGLLAIAAALLFTAHLMHRSHRAWTKHTSIVMSFIAGLAFLTTFIGEWLSGAAWLGIFAVAGLIVCAAIIVIDWLVNRKPDKPAFWAAFVFALLAVLGFSQLPQVGDQIGEGGRQVGAEISKATSDKDGK